MFTQKYIQVDVRLQGDWSWINVIEINVHQKEKTKFAINIKKREKKKREKYDIEPKIYARQINSKKAGSSQIGVNIQKGDTDKRSQRPGFKTRTNRTKLDETKKSQHASACLVYKIRERTFLHSFPIRLGPTERRRNTILSSFNHKSLKLLCHNK